jgi:aminopeptidase N
MLHRYHECCAGVARGPFALPGTQRQYERSVPFAFNHVDLELEVHLDERRVSGTATWQFERRSQDAETMTLDAIGFDVQRVQLRVGKTWKAVSHHYDSEQIEIAIGKHTAGGQLRVEYSAQPTRGLYFLAPDEHTADRPLQVWSQCQDEDARHWFPCHDKPHVKTTASFSITVPRRFSVLCNGEFEAEREDRRRRSKTYTYRMAQRLPSYLFTLVVGEFDKLVDRPAKMPSGREIPVEYWVPKGRKQDGWRGFVRTPEMLELFSSLTGVEYPYARYTQVVVSEFIFGGMENTTATTMYEHVLLDARAAIDIESFDLVAHELAHQWFGDWVTCRDWSHAWLNEGFATYFEHVEREHRVGRDEYLLGVERDLASYLAEAASRYSRALVCHDYHEPIDLFDRHLYEKGGLVLHALRTRVGDDVFWRAIRAYLTAHGEDAVTTENLRAALEDESGCSLERFFDERVYRAGHPSVKAKVTWASGQLTISFEQLTAHRYELDYEVEIHDTNGNIHRLHRSSDEKHTALTSDSKQRPKHVVIDPELRVLGRLAVECPTDLLRHQLEHASSARGRRHAAQLLSKKRDPQTATALAKSLNREREAWLVRAACATALGELRGERAFAALQKSAATHHPKVRNAVAEALGRFRTQESCRTLSQMLRGEKSYLVQATATRALGRTRQADAERLIRSQLKKPSWGSVVPAAAADALATLKSPEALALLIAETQPGRATRIRRSAALALAKLSNERTTREHLEAMLDDAHPHLRMDVAQALGSLEDRAVRPALDRQLRAEQDGRVSRRIREVLRNLDQNDSNRELKERISQLERQLGDVLSRVAILESHGKGKTT